MVDPKTIEQIASQIYESIPKNIREFRNEIEKKIRRILHTQLMHVNLISREEFDMQTQILLRTREKISILEQRIIKLENSHIANKIKSDNIADQDNQL